MRESVLLFGTVGVGLLVFYYTCRRPGDPGQVRAAPAVSPPSPPDAGALVVPAPAPIEQPEVGPAPAPLWAPAELPPRSEALSPPRPQPRSRPDNRGAAWRTGGSAHRFEQPKRGARVR